MVKSLYAVLLILLLMAGCQTCIFLSKSATVVANELAPETLLKKYEYFKDLSAAIDKKKADIQVYKEEIEFQRDNLADAEDKEYLRQKTTEMMGIITAHNQLCAEYNSAMSKFNYAFANTGQLPQSNMQPLPREMKPYILQF
jgi:biopolymer transport protein ExbB/TolQ